MHIDTISNGMGGQSMLLLVLRREGRIRGDLSITSDTGSENDCLWSTGRRTDARTFYEEIIAPLCKETNIESAFVRSVDKYGKMLPALHEAMIMGDTPKFVPFFGSRGGRMRQECTEKWKVRAMRQECRRRGATSMCSAIGLHAGEVRRVKGPIIESSKKPSEAVIKVLLKAGFDVSARKVNPDGFNIFQSGEMRGKGDDKKWRPLRWATHFYPLIDLNLTRQDCRKRLHELDIPYLVSSECDHCPHKDGPRWARTSHETIQRCVELEEQLAGNFFFTDQRIPLRMAIPNMKMPEEDDVDFGCENDVCGI